MPRRQRLRRGGAGCARIYREVPVNAIWEGSGNVMALDVLRVLQREPETVEIVMDDLGEAVGGDAHLKAHWRACRVCCTSRCCSIARGRQLVEALACWRPARSCSAHAPAAVADAFIAHARFSGGSSRPTARDSSWADTRAIVARASPHRE